MLTAAPAGVAYLLGSFSVSVPSVEPETAHVGWSLPATTQNSPGLTLYAPAIVTAPAIVEPAATAAVTVPATTSDGAALLTFWSMYVSKPRIRPRVALSNAVPKSPRC